MRPQQQNRRMRGRNNNNNSNNNNNNNNNRKGPNPLTRNYESNGPDVKIRGSAQQIAEKYTTLARDAQSAGDRVMAENYLQHAEHYNRIIAAAQAQMPAVQQIRDNRDDFDDDDDDDRDDRCRATAANAAATAAAQPPGVSGPQPVIEGVAGRSGARDRDEPVDRRGSPKARHSAGNRSRTPVSGGQSNGAHADNGGARRGSGTRRPQPPRRRTRPWATTDQAGREAAGPPAKQTAVSRPSIRAPRREPDRDRPTAETPGIFDDDSSGEAPCLAVFFVDR